MWLRFKFYSFFDLKPTKPNLVRLNQLYEQAKWSVLGEEVEATDEEAFNFAGLQYQIKTRQVLETSTNEDMLQTSNLLTPGPGPISPTSNVGTIQTSRPVNADDVDAAITQLQFQLETGISPKGASSGQSSSAVNRSLSPTTASPASAGQENLQEIPELKEYIKISRKSRFGFNKFSSSSPYWLVLRDHQLSVYRSKEEAAKANPPLEVMKLVGCEVQALARSSSDSKFVIRLFVPQSDGMKELVLKCKTVQQYAHWVGAFKLCSLGKTMADASYESECKGILSSLMSPVRQKMTISSPMGGKASPNPPVELNVAEYLPLSVAKRYKLKDSINRILEAHSRISDKSSTDAKIAYIRQWESLPDVDVNYFLVKIVNNSHPSKNNNENVDVLGITPTKLIHYDSPRTMSIVAAWPYQRITSWQVDWEKHIVKIESDDGSFSFTCSSCDCKVFHEMLGGYIFMSLRSSAQNRQLDEEMFQKLTGGRE